MSSNLFIATVLFGIITRVFTEMQQNDIDFLKKQELVFQLLWHTKDVPKNHPEVFERIKNYKLEDVAVACENQTHVKEFESHLKHSTLPRGEIFSWYREEHVKGIRSVYFIFRNAKNFDEFVALAAWSSLHLNKLVWLHAFASALAHRPDCKNLRMPNLHEIIPEYFFNADVIMMGYKAKSGEIAGVSDQFIIQANYTADEPTQETSPESLISYFLEDVGLNEFYFHTTINSPFWLSNDELGLHSKNLRGEMYYHMHKWLLARYKLERQSLGLAEVEDIDWEQPILIGFRPSMIHENGLLFPGRESSARLPAYKYGYLEEVKHYEHRISKAIDLGEIRTFDSRIKKLYDDSNPLAFTDFCNVIEGNVDTPNSKLYGSIDRLYRRLMGFAPETRRPVPAALEMPMTSLRDPGFFRIVKRIVEFGKKFKENLPSYKHDELNFDGVRIDYVHVERLTTYFDTFESVLHHPRILKLDDRPTISPMVSVKVKQMRLDHKHFNFEIGASCEKSMKAIVRVFLGPKFDVHGREINLEENFDDFYELDRWIVELKQGSNKLPRNSADSIYTSPEPLPSDTFNRQLNRAFKTSDENLMRDSLSRCRTRRGIPLRLLIPRGNKAGLPLRFLVCLHAVEASRIIEESGMLMDGRPMGFPLDRKLDMELSRNCMIRDVRVYHEDVEDVEKE